VIIRDLFNGKKSFREFFESPEKISTSVLANRLQLLEGAGIAEHILSVKDKKVKWYYLTDRGIDLFPIVYEMVYWSKRNLGHEFHPFSKEWFKKYESWTPEQTIIENQKIYIEKREELLELQ
jgi:DNA-binding HxlR family transcriptional regulator